MSDRAKKISELTSLVSVSGDDLLVIVDSPSGNAVTKKVTVNTFFSTYTANSFTANTINVYALNVSEHVHYSVTDQQYGNTSGITISNYQTYATALDMTKQVQMLHSLDAGQNHYYLEDGMEGQLMFFVPMHSTNMDNIYIWIDNLRAFNQINPIQGAVWSPFIMTSENRTIATAIFTDGAWNIDNNSYT